MRVECIEINALVGVHQIGTFGDWDGDASPLPSGLRGSGGQDSQCNNGGCESEAHSSQVNVTKEERKT